MGFEDVLKVGGKGLGKVVGAPLTIGWGLKDVATNLDKDDQGAISQVGSSSHNFLNSVTIGGWGWAGSKVGIAAPDGSSWGQYKTKAEHDLAKAEKKEAKREKAQEAYEKDHPIANTVSEVGKNAQGALSGAAEWISKQASSLGADGISSPVGMALAGVGGLIVGKMGIDKIREMHQNREMKEQMGPMRPGLSQMGYAVMPAPVMGYPAPAGYDPSNFSH